MDYFDEPFDAPAPYNVYGEPCFSYADACHAAGVLTPQEEAEEEAWYAMVQDVKNLRTPVAEAYCLCDCTKGKPIQQPVAD